MSRIDLVPICDSYAYQADLICEDCALQVTEELDTKGVEDDGDTDTYPQRVQSNECDSPPHCGNHDKCVNAVEILSGKKIGCPLECSLTSDGSNYVAKNVAEHLLFGSNHQRGVALLWRHLYRNYLRDVPLMELSTKKFPSTLTKKVVHLTRDMHLTLCPETFTDLWHIYGCAHNQYHTVLWKLEVTDDGGFTSLQIVMLPPSERNERPIRDMVVEAVSEDAWE